jgi:hypothetical protein
MLNSNLFVFLVSLWKRIQIETLPDIWTRKFQRVFCTMKFLTLIFTLYMLTLSCVPCICEDICANNKTEQSHSKDKQDKGCASFCSCSCCHSTPANIKLLLPIKANPEFSKSKFILADQQYISYQCHNIWQPPKLS